MKIIDTSTTRPEDLSIWEQEQVYNGKDACVTAEVIEILKQQLDRSTQHTYDFSRALQGPVLEMRLRGCKIDLARKIEVLDQCFEAIDQLENQLETIVLDGIGMTGFNWKSNDDLQTLFYDILDIPVEMYKGKPTVNRPALEKIGQYTLAKPIIYHITAMKDLFAQIKVLKTAIDPDGYIRSSINIAGTDTFRFSSSFSEFGTGTNLQNIEEALRSIFISNPGMKFCKCDGAQIQSRVMGAMQWNALREESYLRACEADDLHTVVAKMVWPGLPWTGDPKKDKVIAERPFYRHYTHRFMCKKIGHGSNFLGRPPTIATQTRLPEKLIADFQPLYYKTFPGHYALGDWVGMELARCSHLYGLGGRRRFFWGRKNDDKIIREALAYFGQEGESWIVNNGMLRAWRDRVAIIMFQDHDATTWMYPEEREDEVIPRIMEALRFPVALAEGRELVVPFDCKVGWNRGDYNEQSNPDGLKEYGSGDKRRRSEKVSILDRRVRSKH